MHRGTRHQPRPGWLLAALLGAALLAAPDAGAEPTEPRTVQVGVFVASLFALDFYAGTFRGIFWVWWIYDDEAYAPFEGIEIVNAREYTQLERYTHLRSDGRRYAAAKYTAVFNQPWDTSHFPFDRQRLTIKLESIGLDASKLVFVPDEVDSVVGPEVVLPGWRIHSLEMAASAFRYNSRFGEEAGEMVAYPRLVVSVPLTRDNHAMFVNVYIGYFIAFLVCAAMGLIDVANLSDRLVLIISAIFAAIGNKYVIDSIYPSPARFSLADQIEISTFALVVLALLLAIHVKRADERGDARRARVLNRSGSIGLVIGYLLVVGTCVGLAMA